MLGAGGVGSDEGQVDLVFHGGRQFLLGVFSGFLEALESHAVLREVDAVLALELADHVLDDALVEVFAAEEGVAVGGAHFDDVVAHFEDGDIEGAAAEVVHGDLFVGLAVEAVGEGSGGGFVDDALHFKTGDLAGVLGGLALGVVEVGGNGDDSFGHGFAEVSFGVLLELGKDDGGDFLSAVIVAVHAHGGVAVSGGNDGVRSVLHPVEHFGGVGAAAHPTLDGEDGAVGVGDGLTLGSLAHEAFLIGDGDDRGSGTAAVGVADALGFLAFHHIDAAVGGAKVDADDLTHDISP